MLYFGNPKVTGHKAAHSFAIYISVLPFLNERKTKYIRIDGYHYAIKHQYGPSKKQFRIPIWAHKNDATKRNNQIVVHFFFKTH